MKIHKKPFQTLDEVKLLDAKMKREKELLIDPRYNALKIQTEINKGNIRQRLKPEIITINYQEQKKNRRLGDF